MKDTLESLPNRPLVSFTNNWDCSLMDRSPLTILHWVSICMRNACISSKYFHDAICFKGTLFDLQSFTESPGNQTLMFVVMFFDMSHKVKKKNLLSSTWCEAWTVVCGGYHGNQVYSV